MTIAKALAGVQYALSWWGSCLTSERRWHKVFCWPWVALVWSCPLWHLWALLILSQSWQPFSGEQTQEVSSGWMWNSCPARPRQLSSYVLVLCWRQISRLANQTNIQLLRVLYGEQENERHAQKKDGGMAKIDVFCLTKQVSESRTS